MLISGEIYNTGKNFILTPAVTAGTNLSSESLLLEFLLDSLSRTRATWRINPPLTNIISLCRVFHVHSQSIWHKCFPSNGVFPPHWLVVSSLTNIISLCHVLHVHKQTLPRQWSLSCTPGHLCLAKAERTSPLLSFSQGRLQIALNIYHRFSWRNLWIKMFIKSQEYSWW